MSKLCETHPPVESRSVNIQQELEWFILAEFPVDDRTSVGSDEDLLGGGLVDSLGILQLIAFIEERFAVKLDADEILPENFRNLRSLEELVTRKRNALSH